MNQIKTYLSIATIFTLISSSGALSHIGGPEQHGESIFPFDNKRTVEYTEDLIEVSENGIDEDHTHEHLTEIENNHPINELNAYQQTILNNWGGKKEFTEKRLNSIKEDLENEMIHFVEQEKKIEEIEKSFEPIKTEIKNLQEQIDLVNTQINLSKKKIQNTEAQLAEKEIELITSIKKLQEKEVHLKISEKTVLEYIQLVYQEEEKYLDFYKDGSSTIKLLLADGSMSSEILNQEYAEILENTGRKVFHELNQKKLEIADQTQQIEIERKKLSNLHLALKNEKKTLENSRKGRRDLLEKTLGEEQKFQELLEESIKQQLESALAIQNMKDNIGFIESKLNILDQSIEEAGKFDLNQNSNKEIKEQIDSLNSNIEDELVSLPSEVIPDKQNFIWPVPPLKITAQFHDPTYPKKWGPHNAIDLRAKQYTEVVAPANGYVFQAKDNGFGYSYIILAHKGNLVTVYGHMSEMFVKPGMVVKQGDVIGLSGGTPGTKGAGLQTTGPHLHFEVWKKGKAVDPLDYLPVFDLPIESIPERFLKE